MASSFTSGHSSEIETTHAFDEIAPPSVFASTSATHFDVFINHRGPDVKHSLARSMYHALHVTGLRVFFYSEELELGDFLPRALEAAMSSASFHVAIFSPTYAESPWCLAELSFMLKSGATIIPVFYHVKPTDLRWVTQGKGLYAKAFLEHQQKGRHSLQKLEEWKIALHNVSFNKGEIVNNNDEEQMTLKTIVNHVLKVMQIVPLEVAKHPVGLEEVVLEFEKMIAYELRNTKSNVQIMGILGMGGSGKTTFAKELYNKKYSSVNRSSFIFDIRNAAAKNKLYKKQIELLKDLGFKGETFENTEKCKGILSKHLRSNCVLIILDDVDHIDQLDALLPTKDNLGVGSLIIVTTREKEVLQRWGISSIYEMKAMNLFDAKQLFCWHAFLQPYPRLGFEELTEKFLSASNGLPLSLKVLGGQLYGCFDKDLWRDLLDKISKILPTDIKNCLKVSYDALDVQEKQIFLDTACFFIGKDNRKAIAVWEGSGWNGLYGWNRLVNKCLADLDDDNRIKMHDHLRDLGREIAHTQSPYRMWSPLSDQMKDIQKREGDRFQIRGIMLNTETDDCSELPGFLVNTSTGFSGFWSCSRRPPFRLAKEIFFVGENYVDKGICNLSGELTCLSCTYIDHTHLPSWLPLKNLRVLELAYSDKLRHLWKVGDDAPVKLQELVIDGCERFQGFPKSIGLLRHLKKIVVEGCQKLRSLPKGFCLLRSLEHLQLIDCNMLTSLPSNFGNLTNLLHLELSNCYKLRMLPISFKQLRLLQHLSIEGCYELTLESDILEYVAKLEYLSLSELPQMKELPHHITNQASLRNLHLGATRIGKLSENIGQLSNLRVIVIESCKIGALPESMGCLTLLERLELQYLAVECLPQSFTQLISLQFFIVAGCPISELPFGWEPFTSSMCKLKEISLSWTRVSKICISDECCPGLLTLKLHHNGNLRELHTLPTALKIIEVDGCERLEKVRGINGSSNLQILKIKSSPNLDALPMFAELTSLQVIEMTDCGRVKKIHGLENCKSLNTLVIFSCSGLKAIPSLGGLTCLRKIELNDCQEVSKIESLKHCRSLEVLLISGCPELHSLPSFADLTYLKVFEMTDCGRVQKIEGLEHCRSLNTLVIFSCSELNAIPSLSELTSLRKIELNNCHKVSNMGSLQHCGSLEALLIRGCPELLSLPSFSGLISLKVFELKGRNKVEKMEGLQHCVSLEKLVVEYTCWEVPCIESSLENMQRLSMLQLVGKKRSAIEPFIQTIQKWPTEIIICTKAAAGAGSLLNSFRFPKLSVVHSFANKMMIEIAALGKPSSNANAFMLCLVINCRSPRMMLTINAFKKSLIGMDEGKAIVIGVFTQHSRFINTLYLDIEQDNQTSWVDIEDDEGNGVTEVETGLVVSGEENSIVKAFHHLFELLGAS